jgi:predicted ATP-dependent Lon-type protease
MRTLFVFVLGLALGAAAFYYYQNNGTSWHDSMARSGASASTSTRQAADTAASKTRALASDVSETFSQKMRDWHLTKDDIHADLAKTGEIARQNAERAREKVADVRIITMVKAKYVLDRDLSAHTITVDCHEGNVTLSGSVASEALIGKAVALALDTDGVRHVKAKLGIGAASGQ